MASNGNARGASAQRGASNSGFRGAGNNHAGGRGGANAASRGGASAGGPQPSRWGNGPPANTAASAPHAHPRNVPGARPAPDNSAKAANQRTAAPPSQSNNNQQSSAFPASAPASAQGDSQKLMHDRMMFLLVTLVGNPVTVTVKGGSQYFGIFSAANTEGGELGVALSSAQQILPADVKDGQPQLGALKSSLLINAKDLESIQAAEVRVQDQAKEMREAREKEAFRTDTEISKAFDPLGSGRALQKWSDDPDLADLDDHSSKLPAWASPSDAKASGAGGLEDSNSNKPWDQFAANEARFGIKSNYEENLYTTKLDRTGKDFRDREREADRIAREIMGQATNNPHMAEERGHADDSGVNEEDKYGAVVRNPNAYVPPALRNKSGAGAATVAAKKPSPAAPAAAAPAKFNGAAPPAPAAPADVVSAAPAPVATNLPTVNVKVPSPSIPQEPTSKDAAGKKASIDAANPLMGDFRQFVSSERERLEKKKAALAKKEKDTRLADLKSWASSFKLKTPMPSDVADMVQKDKADAASDKPRDPSLQKSLSPTPAHSAAVAAVKADASRSSATSRAAQALSNVVSPAGGSGSAEASRDAHKLAESKALLQKMTIPKIPPFNPDKFKARQAAAAAGTGGEADDAAKAPTKPEGGMPSSISTSSFKLSAKASSFKPFNPNAATFTPGGASFTPAAPPSNAAAAASPAPGAAAGPSLSARPSLTSTPPTASTSAAAPANPFFGNRIIKKSNTPLHIRDDFNPFKVSKVPDAKAVGPMWAFSGKSYRQHFVVAPPGALMDDGSGLYVAGPGGMMQPGMHPGGQTPQHVPQPMHPGQMSQPGPGPAGPGPVPAPVPGPGPTQGPGPPQQPFGMVYQPYAGAPYQYPGGQPPAQGMPQGRQPGMMQPMQMAPSMQGAPMPYGGVPQQFMGQMPFSPPMHQHGAPQNMYSPQMGNVPPAGQAQFMPMPPPGAGGPRPPPPHMQKGQPHPPGAQPHMYYPGQPGANMPYGAAPQFGGQPPHAGPQAQGGAAPRVGPGESGPASSAASSTA
ncbi:protein interacting with poly(A)-binding protein [Moesziomyces antarcticus T-34]|uniref:Protein interacting with poly(A)-binding protein n=1 Tax=Pseudozyma antarctica (strain T-34) TaxID=1151754 RepID=M9MCK2_PSEA3|nr:protein interacting with poly(A)-binding protein [Moesziomyces antarcticus T-34]